MRRKNSYSRIIQSTIDWRGHTKSQLIKLLHHSVEAGITSFYIPQEAVADMPFGDALSESGLSRDDIQILTSISAAKRQEDQIADVLEQLLLLLDTDFIDLVFLHNKKLPERQDELEYLLLKGKVYEFGYFSGQAERLLGLPQGLKVKPSLLPDNQKLLQEDRYPNLPLFVELLRSIPTNVQLELSQKYELSSQGLLQAVLLKRFDNLHLFVPGEGEEVEEAIVAKKKYIAPEDLKKISFNIEP